MAVTRGQTRSGHCAALPGQSPRENVIIMKCRMRGKLADYQVGALNERQCDMIARHLQDCPACQAELAALNRTAALLQPMRRVDAPREVWAAVACQLTPRRAASRAGRGARRVWIPAAAAAMLILIVALVVLGPMMHGHLAAPSGQDSYADIQVAAAWDNPLSDKAALGLAVLATEDSDPLQDLQEVTD